MSRYWCWYSWLSFPTTKLVRFDIAPLRKTCCDSPAARHESSLEAVRPGRKGGEFAAYARFLIAFEESISLAIAFAMIRPHYG